MKHVIFAIFLYAFLPALAFGRCGDVDLEKLPLVKPVVLKLAGLQEDLRLERRELKCANLTGQNLSNRLFLEADLEFAVMPGCTLKNAKFIKANLYGAILAGANLEGADLTGADLRDSDLRGVNFENANLSGANLEGARVDDKTNFKNATLKWCRLKNLRPESYKIPLVLDPTLMTALASMVPDDIAQAAIDLLFQPVPDSPPHSSSSSSPTGPDSGKCSVAKAAGRAIKNLESSVRAKSPRKPVKGVFES